MTKDEAIEKFFPMVDDSTFGKTFIRGIYDEGYLVLTPEEVKKVDACIVLADVHGMNPFAPGGRS